MDMIWIKFTYSEKPMHAVGYLENPERSVTSDLDFSCLSMKIVIMMNFTDKNCPGKPRD